MVHTKTAENWYQKEVTAPKTKEKYRKKNTGRKMRQNRHEVHLASFSAKMRQKRHEVYSVSFLGKVPGGKFS